MRRRGGRWARGPRSLQRKMFFFFGATILMTGLTVAAVMWLMGSSGPTWHQEFARVQRFTLRRFARVWDSPRERDEFARSLAGDLDVDVQLTDADGRVLGTFGQPLTCPAPGAKVTRDGEVLGALRVCATRHHGFGPGRLLTALLVAGGMLWGASGVLSRKLSRPIAELVRVAQDIGAGRLSSRVRPGRHPVGEVRVLGEVLNDMASRIEQQMADQRALLATVSHEIRTPLARMRLLVEMARDGGGEPLDKIDQEVVEIDALVAELLASSRLDFSALSLTRLDARKVALDALERGGVDAALLLDETAEGAFRGDPTLVARAVSNLVENGKRHGGGVVSLRLYERAGRVVFEVSDNGPGIEPGDEAKIFQPFYRHSQDPRSVGLGLSLVKRIAEAHGGTAYAENRDGKGARVGVEFSVGEPDSERPSLHAARNHDPSLGRAPEPQRG